MIILLVLNFLAAVSSYRLARGVFKAFGRADSLIAWFLLYLALIIASELALGMAGILSAGNLVILHAGICAAVWVATRRTQPDTVLPAVSELWSFISGSKLMLFVCALVSGFALVKLGINLVNPPFGWDSLNYHFTFPVEWLKSGTLNNPVTVFDDPSPPYYPINGSLFYFWLIAPLQSVFLADLGQVPFFILGFLAVYGIGRKLGLDREWAFFSAALFSFIPNYFKQLEIAYVDVMIAALFLAALNFLLRLEKEFSGAHAVFWALSMGLFIGTKTVALPYSLLLALPFALIMARDYRRFRFLIPALALITALGGFSYIRNYLQTGNPLYPLDFTFFGQHIFKGVMSREVYGFRFSGADYSLGKLLFHEGLGVQTLLFVLPASFAGLAVSFFRNKGRSIGLVPLFCLVLPVLIFFIFRCVIPLANTRYLYILLGVGMVNGFYMAQLLRLPRAVIGVLVFVCVMASASEAAVRGELIAGLAFSAVIWLMLLYLRRDRRKRTGFKLNRAAGALILAACVGVFILLERDYARNEFRRYVSCVKYSGFWPDAAAAWEWLNQHSNGDTIAYAGRPVPFPLYGSGFKNKVDYVSVNATDPARLEYFPGSRYRWRGNYESLHTNQRSRKNYRGNAQYPVWLGNLKRRGVDYVFVYSLHQTETTVFPIEDIWAQGHRDVFTRVFENETVRIYRVKKL